MFVNPNFWFSPPKQPPPFPPPPLFSNKGPLYSLKVVVRLFGLGRGSGEFLTHEFSIFSFPHLKLLVTEHPYLCGFMSSLIKQTWILTSAVVSIASSENQYKNIVNNKITDFKNF